MSINTTSQAAAYIGGSNPPTVRTLANWRKRGIGPDYIRVGNKIRYTTEALQRYLEINTVKCGEAS